MVPTTFKLTISPFAFLTLRNFIKKYQKRDFATTVLGANILIRYSFGAGFASDGRWRPMTWYSVRRPIEASQHQHFAIVVPSSPSWYIAFDSRIPAETSADLVGSPPAILVGVPQRCDRSLSSFSIWDSSIPAQTRSNVECRPFPLATIKPFLEPHPIDTKLFFTV
jgi:hypothetical protein